MQEIITSIFNVLAPAVFAALVFTVASDITFKNIQSELKNPSRILKTSVVGIVLVPAITAIVFKLFNADIVVTGIAVLAAIAPGDSFALLEAESKKARMNLAAVIMAWLCLLMPFTVPLWLGPLSKLFHLSLKVSPFEIFKTIAPLTIFPLIAGVLIRESFPKLSEILKKLTCIFFKVAILIVAAICLIAATKGLAHYTLNSIAAIFLAVTIALFLGYYSGFSDRKEKLASAISVSLGNFALVLLVAHTSYPEAHIAPQAIVFVLIRWVVIMFWYILLKVFLHKRGIIF